MKIKCNWTGELIEAIPWNGEHEGIKYPFDDCEEHMQGTDGTIYYKHGDGWNIWCSVSELKKHLIRLNQIASWPIREPVLVPAERSNENEVQ